MVNMQNDSLSWKRRERVFEYWIGVNNDLKQHSFRE